MKNIVSNQKISGFQFLAEWISKEFGFAVVGISLSDFQTNDFCTTGGKVLNFGKSKEVFFSGLYSESVQLGASQENRNLFQESPFRDLEILIGNEPALFLAAIAIRLQKNTKGLLCLFDTKARDLEASAIYTIRKMAQFEAERFDLESEIIENRKLEQELFFERERFELAVAGTNAGLWDWNVRTGEVYFSEKWKSMLGYQDSEIENSFEAWLNLMHPQDRPIANKKLEDYFHSRVAEYDFEHRLRCKNGDYRWILSKGVCTRDESNHVVRLTGWHIDIHERRELLNQIQEEKDKLDFISSVLSDYFFSLDVSKENQVMTYLGKGFENIWEMSPDKFLEDVTYFRQFIHPEDLAGLDQIFQTSKYAAGEFEFRVTTASGKSKWLCIKFFPVKSETGQTTRINGITSDISERKKIEQLVENQRASLVASSKFSSLGEMAAGIAHEINNPLTVISATSEKLVLTLDKVGLVQDADLRQTVDKITSSVQRIAKIVKGMRTFSREGGGDPFVEYSVSSLIHEALAVCEGGLNKEGVTVACGEVEPIKIECRPSQIIQILVNLILNARDAVCLGSARLIKIQAKKENEMVLIRVTDSGPGLNKTIQDKIMTPFFTTKPPGYGTGLGLSLSLGIARNHHGKLVFEQNNPTTFLLALPISQQRSSAELES